MSVTNTAGETLPLSTYWRDKPLVLVFLRHFGCAFCKEQAMRLRSDYGKFKAVGANVVCVGMGPFKAAKAFQILYDLPFEVVTVGDDLSLYKAYGLVYGTIEAAINRVVVRGILRNLMQGRFNNVVARNGDKRQLGGTFVVGTDGVVLFGFRAKNPTEIPTATELLDRLPRA